MNKAGLFSVITFDKNDNDNDNSSDNNNKRESK